MCAPLFVGHRHAKTISSEEISHSYAFFHRLCVTDKLSEKETRDFFQKSLLPDGDFDQIWKLSDIDKDGFLTIGEFIVFVHFVKEKFLNELLPKDIPAYLKEKVLPFKLPSCSDEHIAKCKMVFREYKHFIDSEGKMAVEGAKVLLSRSRLSSSQLFHIWKLSDLDCDEKLVFTEFVVAIHLINLALKGYSLPVFLKHKQILKSKKVTAPDLSAPVSKVKLAHIPWIQSGSAPPTVHTKSSSSHFVLPSTPLSPGPGLPTPEHPFMSFSTFARYGPPSPLLQRQHNDPTGVASASGVQSGNGKKIPRYVNMTIGIDGPATPGNQVSMSPPPPPLPPRPQGSSQVATQPTSTPSPSHISPIPVRMVPISTSSSPSPPPPAQLSRVDPNLEFMKSLEDLASIGSFDLMSSLSPPLSPLVKDTKMKKSVDDELMAADLDDLVAALSEMESSILSLDDSPKVTSKAVHEKKGTTPSRKSSLTVDTSRLLKESGIDNLEEAIEGAIRDTSPVQEVELHARKLSSHAEQQQQSQISSQKETLDLVSSLQSVADVKGSKGVVKTTSSSIHSVDGEIKNGMKSKPLVPEKKTDVKLVQNGSRNMKTSTSSFDPDDYLKEELDSMHRVLEQFS